MKLHGYLAAAMLLSSTVSYAGWGSRFDPFNRHSVFRGMGRAIDPTNVLRDAKRFALSRMSRAISEDEDFKKKARENGWTFAKCTTAGRALAVPIIGLKGTAICALSTAAEPAATTTCVAFLLASAEAITQIACTQLCHDHHLRGCE